MEENKEDQGFLVPCLRKTTRYLNDNLTILSGFLWLCKILKIIPDKKACRIQVEIWVLFNLALSIMILIYLSPYNIIWPLLIYSMLRIYGIIVSTTCHRVFDLPNTDKVTNFYIRGMILGLFNITESIFWFAIIYRNLYQYFYIKEMAINTFWGSLSFSINSITTLGSNYTVLGEYSFLMILPGIEAILGLYFITIIISSFVSAMNSAKSKSNIKHIKKVL
jgi:hypothetical protein